MIVLGCRNFGPLHNLTLPPDEQHAPIVRIYLLPLRKRGEDRRQGFAGRKQTGLNIVLLEYGERPRFEIQEFDLVREYPRTLIDLAAAVNEHLVFRPSRPEQVPAESVTVV